MTTSTSTPTPAAASASTSPSVVSSLSPADAATTRRERFTLLLVIGVACGVILPLLGATGFFDPWETNYAEVAREMSVRDDYVYPFWKDAFFFSKPILLFWLTAPLYRLVGAHEPGPMPHSVELLGRLPSAVLGIATIVVAYVIARRFWSRREAAVAALVLATTPFWAFLSRQAITDMPYVSLTSLGLLLLAPSLLADDDERDRVQAARLPRPLLALIATALVPQLWQIARTGAFLNRVPNEAVVRVVVGVVFVCAALGFVWFLATRARDAFFHAACLCFGLSMLAKGPVGVAIGGLVVVVVVVAVFGFAGLVRLFLHPALVSGLALFFAVSLPWPLVMLAFDGLDDQRKTWFQRFVLYDLLGRVGAGVHGDRGGVEYYVRYVGVGMLPWSGFVPIALFDAVSALRASAAERLADRATRFTLFLFVWAFVSFCFFTGTTTKFHHYILPFIAPAALLVGRLVARAAEDVRGAVVVFALAAVVSVLCARDLAAEPWDWIDLFTYHYKGYKPEYYFPVDTLDTMPLPDIGAWKDETVSLYRVLPLVSGGVFVCGVALALALYQGKRRSAVVDDILDVDAAPAAGLVVGAVCAAALCAVLSVQVFWARASQHWSQRWIFETYESQRKPGDALIAFQMDWKGETFYSKNTDIQIKKNASDLRAAVDRPGRDFVLVQTDRLDGLKAAVGAKNRLTVVDKSNAKWLLVLVE